MEADKKHLCDFKINRTKNTVTNSLCVQKFNFYENLCLDEVRAKREPSLCNESVNVHFWSNLCLNCIFKWT